MQCSGSTNKKIHRLQSSQREGYDKLHEGRDGNKPEKFSRKIIYSNWVLKTRSSQTRRERQLGRRYDADTCLKHSDGHIAC